ncbi:MAG TPA: Lrp/AsnC family transcriptional regulator [Planctomycetota bacterium]|nr:Lrp/AsnC family transcriptional regulator [Planctomycetota bacterium]
MIDTIDRRILDLLQANARTSNVDIARELHMAPSAILERTRKLEQRGILVGYEGRVSAKAIGLGLTAFVFVRADECTGSTVSGEAMAAIPEVQEVHAVAGEDCYLVKMRARDTEDLARLLRERLGPIPGVSSTRTTIVLGTLKETATLPLDRLSERP